MSKKPAKTAAPGSTDAAAPKKRSKVKLALFTLVPVLLLGAGGYVGYTQFYALAHASPTADAGEAGHSGETGEDAGAEHHGTDPATVAALPREILAETSFTHSLAVASIIGERCGGYLGPLTALKAASDEEARADGLLVNLSWTAAARRTVTLDERSCGYFLAEIQVADAKAARLADAKAAPEKAEKAAASKH